MSTIQVWAFVAYAFYCSFKFLALLNVKIVVMFEDMPMVSYDQAETGWGHIYNGILSPFANKYKVYIKSELKTRA